MSEPDDDDDLAIADAQARAVRFKLDAGASYDDDELRTLVELSSDLVAITKFDGHFGLLNGAWETALGWSRAELRARPFIDFVHPDDRDKTNTAATRMQGGIQLLTFQNRYRCKDGSYKPMAWRGIVSPDKQRYYTVTRVAADEQKAQERVQVIDAICEHSREAILIQSADGVVLEWSGAGERLFGHRPGDIVGEPVTRFLFLDAAGARPTDLLSLPPAAGADRIPGFFRHKHGAYVSVQLAVTAFGAGSTAVTGAVATFSPLAM